MEKKYLDFITFFRFGRYKHKQIHIISVSSHFIHFIFKICQIVVCTSMSNHFHDFFSRFGSYTDETFTKEGKVRQLEKLVSGKTKFLQAIPALYVEMSIYLLIIRIWNWLSNLLMSTVDLFTQPKRREFVNNKTRKSYWLLIKLGILVFWL